jgi:hypothetical protein
VVVKSIRPLREGRSGSTQGKETGKVPKHAHFAPDGSDIRNDGRERLGGYPYLVFRALNLAVSNLLRGLLLTL